MATICPTITAYDPHEYREQIERLQPFAVRIHIDLMDGEFTQTKSPSLEQIWWPPEFTADIHLMYQRPMETVEKLISLKPNLVIIHKEAEVDHADFANKLRAADIKVGLAFLKDTPIDDAFELISAFDHVLVFSGDLGRHGGTADLSLLDKVRQLRTQHPQIEISWDGGINDQNANQLVEAGIDVLNVGGFIQGASDPKASYQALESIAK